jgi:hypothetical protein
VPAFGPRILCTMCGAIGPDARLILQPASAQRCPAPPRGQRGRRRAQSRTWAAAQPQPTSNTRSPLRGAAKASKASVTCIKVVSVCAYRDTQVLPPCPFQKASMSALICWGRPCESFCWVGTDVAVLQSVPQVAARRCYLDRHSRIMAYLMLGPDVRSGSLADIARPLLNVRFASESRHWVAPERCPLWADSVEKVRASTRPKIFSLKRAF